MINTIHPLHPPSQKTKMGSEGNTVIRKPRFLCLHGFRTSGEILKKQVSRWPESVHQRLDLVFVDGPCLAQGKSDVEGYFDPPYYEWFQFNKEFTDYVNFDECLEYIENCVIKYGPIDGFLGFSQGAILSAALPGLQAKGVALTKVPKIKFVVIIGGAKFRHETWAENAYSLPIQIPSVHFLGEEDFLKPYGTELLKSFVDPVIIRHPKGHTVPRLDDQGLESMHSFIDRIQNLVNEGALVNGDAGEKEHNLVNEGALVNGDAGEKEQKLVNEGALVNGDAGEKEKVANGDLGEEEKLAKGDVAAQA